MEKSDLIGLLQINALSDIIKLQKEISNLKNSIQNDKQQDELNSNNNNLVTSQLERQLEEVTRFNEELKITLRERGAKVPAAFLCPISLDIMNDPVVASDGFMYERDQIEKWLKNNNRSPMTGDQLSSKQLTPSHTLKSMIREFIDTNKKQ